MIGFLKGKVIFSDGSQSIILTNSGIGYEVFLNKVLTEGEDSEVYTSHIVREDSETIFGFTQLIEKKVFETLLKVKGVGPKSAYALIQALGHAEVVTAITKEDTAVLTKAPGIGKKAAAQIILDLSNKIEKLKLYDDNLFNEESETFVQRVSARPKVFEEALEACLQLGFKENDIRGKLEAIMEKELIKRPEQLVHLVLKEI